MYDVPFIRQEEETLAHEIQPADVRQVADLGGEQIVDDRTPAGIMPRARVPRRLVERQPEYRLQADAAAVQFDVCGIRIHRGPELRHDFAVHADAAADDEIFAPAAGSHPCPGKILLQSHEPSAPGVASSRQVLPAAARHR